MDTPSPHELMELEMLAKYDLAHGSPETKDRADWLLKLIYHYRRRSGYCLACGRPR
jgi:hypothetical protein